jgi:hypothetical protein
MNAYGSFFSISQQAILQNNNIQFEKSINILNIESNNDNIKILISGIYLIHFTAYFEQHSQIAIFINDKLDEFSIVSSNSNNNCITIHHIFNLNKNDIISFRNYGSYGIISTSILGGLIPQSKNVELTIYKIA